MHNRLIYSLNFHFEKNLSYIDLSFDVFQNFLIVSRLLR